MWSCLSVLAPNFECNLRACGLWVWLGAAEIDSYLSDCHFPHPPAASFPFFYIEPSKKEFLPITQNFVGPVTRKESEEIAPIGGLWSKGGGWRGGMLLVCLPACLLILSACSACPSVFRLACCCRLLFYSIFNLSTF